MSLFGRILSKIFPTGHPATTGGDTATAATPAKTGAGANPTGTAGAAPNPTGTASPTPMKEVDVEAVLNDLAAKNPQKLNWRTSIVDLMKLVGLDSSLESRKALARELHYGGDTNDSAAMNIWLHKQVMTKIAQNGGKVPEDLRS